MIVIELEILRSCGARFLAFLALRVGVLASRTSSTHSGYRRYLYHQGNEQTTGGTVEAAAKPWLIPAGK